MIKQAKPDDAMTLAGLAMTLWKGNSIKEMSNMFESLISDDNAVCFLKYVDGKAIGFAQCQLRHDYVEGTDSSPVGYLEGIFVEAEYRKQKKNIVQSSQVIVNSEMTTVCAFIRLWGLKRQIGSFVSEKIYKQILICR